MSWISTEIAFANQLIAEHFELCRRFIQGISIALSEEFAAEELSETNNVTECSEEASSEATSTCSLDRTYEASWLESVALHENLALQQKLDPARLFGRIGPLTEHPVFNWESNESVCDWI